MKTIILYYSKHHGNTRKIVQAAYTAIDADILDISSPKAAKEDLSWRKLSSGDDQIYKDAYAS